MKIGICDDNLKDRQTVLNWLQTKQTAMRSIEIFEFSSGEALLEHLRRNNLDILFLDGKMNGLNGIETAGKIRIYNNDMLIIIISDYINYAVDGYGVNVFEYVLKKDFHKKMQTIFDRAVQFIDEKAQSAYTVKLVNNLLHVRIVEILYIESKLHKLKMVLRNHKTHEYYGKLDNAEHELKGFGFIRTHKSFLVNCYYVRYLEHKIVELDDGTKLPISRNHYKPALDQFTFYAAGVNL